MGSEYKIADSGGNTWCQSCSECSCLPVVVHHAPLVPHQLETGSLIHPLPPIMAFFTTSLLVVKKTTTLVGEDLLCRRLQWLLWLTWICLKGVSLLRNLLPRARIKWYIYFHYTILALSFFFFLFSVGCIVMDRSLGLFLVSIAVAFSIPYEDLKAFYEHYLITVPLR